MQQTFWYIFFALFILVCAIIGIFLGEWALRRKLYNGYAFALVKYTVLEIALFLILKRIEQWQ